MQKRKVGLYRALHYYYIWGRRTTVLYILVTGTEIIHNEVCSIPYNIACQDPETTIVNISPSECGHPFINCWIFLKIFLKMFINIDSTHLSKSRLNIENMVRYNNDNPVSISKFNVDSWSTLNHKSQCHCTVYPHRAYSA